MLKVSVIIYLKSLNVFYNIKFRFEPQNFNLKNIFLNSPANDAGYN